MITKHLNQNELIIPCYLHIRELAPKGNKFFTMEELHAILEDINQGKLVVGIAEIPIWDSESNEDLYIASFEMPHELIAIKKLKSLGNGPQVKKTC